MKKAILIVFMLIFCIPVFSQEILHERLSNGMEVVVKENTSSTNAMVICFVKTGSIHEGEFLGAGISHFVEHLASGSTTSVRSESDYVDWTEKIGGNSNAYTTYDHTAYFIDVNSEYLQDAINMLSETMQFSLFTEEEVAREKEVIIKEFVYRVAPPMAAMRNRVNETAYLKSHVKNEVIGDIEIFKGLQREDLLKYYKKRYVPNNMIFVVSGNVNPGETLDMIKEAFKDFKPGRLETPYNPTELVKVGEYKYIEEFDISQPRGFITKIIPAGNYRDFLSIDLACEILFYKRNSDLPFRLVEEMKLVNWIYGYFNQGYYSNDHTLNIMFEAKDPKDMDKIVKLTDEIIQEIIRKGISQKQIDDVINRKKAERVLQIQTPENDCMNIGSNMLKYGIPDVYDIHMKEYEKIRPEDIIGVLKEYFSDKNRVIFYGVPTGAKELAAAKDEYVVSEISRIEKENYTVLHKQNTRSPLIHSYFYLPISTDYETAENAGSFEVMTDMMFWGGTKSFDAMEFDSWLEDRYITLRVNIGSNGLYIQSKSLKSDYPELLSRISEILSNPAFSERELELHKQRLKAEYNRKTDDPETIYDDFKDSILYKGQKYGISREKRLEIALNLSRDDLIELYKNYFKADKIICSFFGDLNTDEAIEYSQMVYDSVPKGEIMGDRVPLTIPRLPGIFTNKTPFEQVSIIFNYQAPGMFEEDYIPMTLIQAVLGSGFSGRILKATRRDNNLVYSAYPRYSATKDYGFFRISALTSYNKKDALIEVLKREIEKIREGDIKQEEIDAVTNYYEQQIKYEFMDNYIASNLCYYESVGLGYNYLSELITKFRELTPEKLKETAEKYFNDATIIISEPSEDVQKKFE